MLLTARWLFDGRTPRAFDDMAVRIEGGRIVAVGPAASLRAAVAPGEEVVDFGEATLLPGLIDIHQHLTFDATADAVANLQAADDAALLAHMDAAAQRALAVGITTIRDLGDRDYLSLELRDRYMSGVAVGPRIVAAGPPLTPTGGHCWFLGGVADGVEGVRAAVRERAARGVDVVKVMATGGNMTPTLGPHESQYTLDELAAAVDEAHALGLPLAAHAHGGQGIADALDAGADSIEHCTFFTPDGVAADPAVLDRLARSEVTISTTAAILPGVEAAYPAMRRRVAAILEIQATLVAEGARVVCSSDGGVGPNKPHDVLPWGVTDALPQLGMTNAQALATTTSVAAEVCRIADVTGTLEPGKDADIIAVAGNVVAHLPALHNLIATYTRGHPLPH
jgi:imidazolonepropionase-like amidohydrolase